MLDMGIVADMCSVEGYEDLRSGDLNDPKLPVI